MIKKLRKQWIEATIGYLKHNSRIVIMACSLLLGVLIGTLMIRSNQLTEILNIDSVFHDFVVSRAGKGMVRVLLNSFLSSAVYLLAAYCLGLFVYGTVPSILLPLFRGLGIGSVCGYVYVTHGLKGAAFAMLNIIPFSFLNGLILLVACREAMIFSSSMFSYYTRGFPQSNVLVAFKKYNLRFLVLLFFTALVSVPECLVSGVFISVFGF